MITSDQIRAGRALLRWSAEMLAEQSQLGVATIRRAEAADGVPSITEANLTAIRAALEAAGVIFVAENGEGPGVRLKKAGASDAAREDRVRRGFKKFECQVRKTPSRHWSREHHGPGYMVINSQNIVILGCATREYDASLEDVEDLLEDMIKEEADAE